MLRIHLLQQWFTLSDPLMEEMLIDTPCFRRFAGIETMEGRIPDETTILNFRHLLEEHRIAEQILESVNQILSERGVMLREGTILDATIINAPSSTKNKAKERDPEMHSVAKGNQWFFGMRCHIGVDAASGLVHSVESTAANVHELNTAADRLQGDERFPLCHQRSPLGLSDPPGGPTDHHETDLRRKRSRRCPPADEPAEPRERA
jgi:IS5 family transposase